MINMVSMKYNIIDKIEDFYFEYYYNNLLVRLIIIILIFLLLIYLMRGHIFVELGGCNYPP